METYILDGMIVFLAILIVVCYRSQAKHYAEVEEKKSFNRHVKDALAIANRK